MIYSNKISLFLILLLFLLAVLILVFYKLLNKLIIPAVDNRRLKAFLQLWSYRTELIVWLSFISYCIYKLMLACAPVTIAILILCTTLGWAYWKDLLAGIIFRLEGRVKPGDTIRVSEASGTVESIGRRMLGIKLKNGELLLLPFGNITFKGYNLILEQGRDNLVRFNISKEVAASFGGEKKLKKLIRSCPWASPIQAPGISHLDDSMLEITAWATDAGAREMLKDYILKYLEKYKD